MLALVLSALLVACIQAADPASSWLGYAKAVNPLNKSAIITRIDAYWRNCNNPVKSGCRFTPWFGIESSDNLNLIQPVNPWYNHGSNSWSIYNEYYQWHPSNGESSRSHESKSGDVIYGRVTFDGYKKQSYTMFVSDANDGWGLETVIPVQKSGNSFKDFTIAYFVFEHPCNSCSEYPPDNVITFYNITIWYNDVVLQSPDWSTGMVKDLCSNRANIVTPGSPSTVSITWKS